MKKCSTFSFFFFFYILNILIKESYNKFLQKRNLSEENKSKESVKLNFKEERVLINQQEINYKIYLEMEKLEKEILQNKIEKSEELIKYNKEKWNNERMNQKETKTENINNSNEKLIIPCAYASDNAYIFPNLVSMTSLVANAKNSTFYEIYVLIDSNFSEENKEILKSVEKKHPENCKVILIVMDDKYKNEKTDKRIKTPAYYKLSLHNILPDVNKIIYMDGDTGVFEDLSDLIKLDMKGNYIMGFVDSVPEAIDKFGIINSTVLCSGVLLMDLEALRNNNMTEKFEKFMDEQRENINQHDQTIINVVCQEHIALLPPKYGIWCFEAKKHALKHNKRQRKHLQYDEKEFLDAYYHPAIMHFVWPKPYWRKKKPVFNKEWWEYARMTGYYKDIITKSPKFIRWL